MTSSSGRASITGSDWHRWKKYVRNIIHGNMVLSKDFKEFIELLNANDVRYLIVGSYAVGFHGYLRYTNDPDVLILKDENNAENLLKALELFGMGSLGLTINDFLKSDEFVQLGYPQNRIDIVMSCEGIVFEEAYKHKVQITVDNINVVFISI